VEDNIFNLKTLKMILESNFEFSCDTAINGLVGVEKFEAKI
jgi:hypothetical protein